MSKDCVILLILTNLVYYYKIWYESFYYYSGGVGNLLNSNRLAGHDSHLKWWWLFVDSDTVEPAKEVRVECILGGEDPVVAEKRRKKKDKER